MTRRLFTTAAVGAGLFLAPFSAFSDFRIDSFVVGGGGGSSSGGDYTVSGTAGQPEAGGFLAGATYGAAGGFWSTAVEEAVIVEESPDGWLLL